MSAVEGNVFVGDISGKEVHFMSCTCNVDLSILLWSMKGSSMTGPALVIFARSFKIKDLMFQMS